MDDRGGPLTQPPLQEVVAMRSRKRPYDGDATRDRILAAVKASPGLSKSELQRRLDIGWGNLTHHLEVLKDQDLLAFARSPRATILYPADLGERDARWLALCREASFGLVLSHVLNHPGGRMTEISRTLGIHQHTVRKHLVALEDFGVVQRRGLHGTQIHVDADELRRLVRAAGPCAPADAEHRPLGAQHP